MDPKVPYQFLGVALTIFTRCSKDSSDYHVREEAQMLTVIAGVILVGLLLILVVISLIADELPHETHEKRHD